MITVSLSVRAGPLIISRGVSKQQITAGFQIQAWKNKGGVNSWWLLYNVKNTTRFTIKEKKKKKTKI